MKLDDSGFIAPFPSYLQIPAPDNPFPSYLRYDKTTQMELHIENTGIDGGYYVYQGTRVIFDNSGTSFASLIDSINGTGSLWNLNMTTDSIYIAPGETAQMYFFENPTDHPCQDDGQNCSSANIIPDGNYRTAAWINGYTDQGESFNRSVILGTVVVS